MRILFETFLALMERHHLTKYSKILQFGTQVYLHSLKLNLDRAQKARNAFVRAIRARGLYSTLAEPVLAMYNEGRKNRREALADYV